MVVTITQNVKWHIGINQLESLALNVEQCLQKRIKRLNVLVVHTQKIRLSA